MPDSWVVTFSAKEFEFGGVNQMTCTFYLLFKIS